MQSHAPIWHAVRAKQYFQGGEKPAWFTALNSACESQGWKLETTWVQALKLETSLNEEQVQEQALNIGLWPEGPRARGTKGSGRTFDFLWTARLFCLFCRRSSTPPGKDQ